MVGGDLNQLFNIDIEGYEYAAVKEKYGCWTSRPDYINARYVIIKYERN